MGTKSFWNLVCGFENVISLMLKMNLVFAVVLLPPLLYGDLQSATYYVIGISYAIILVFVVLATVVIRQCAKREKRIT